MSELPTQQASGLIAKEGLELLTFSVPSGAYEHQDVDLRKGVHKQKWYTEIQATGKIPALIDHDNGDLAIMDGYAILNYLVRKYDKDRRFSFEDGDEQCLCDQWIGFAQSHLGPDNARAVYFLRLDPEQDQYAIQHFVGVVERMYGILDSRLASRDYIVGDRFSIADIANFASVDVGPAAGVDRSQFPNLYKWWKRISSRPAVQKGSSVPFPNPLLGAEYLRRLQEEPGVQEREDEVFAAINAAKERYGYKYESP